MTDPTPDRPADPCPACGAPLHPGAVVTLDAPGEPGDGLRVTVLDVTPDWFAWVAPGVRHPRAAEGWELHGRALWSEVAAPTPGPAARAADTRNRAGERARESGYTGDSCDTCGSFAMKRNGACLVCESCGTSGGCG